MEGNETLKNDVAGSVREILHWEDTGIAILWGSGPHWGPVCRHLKGWATEVKSPPLIQRPGDLYSFQAWEPPCLE
jgi:hypothetical protein